MKYLTIVVVSFILTMSSCAQTKNTTIGGPCEGCEAIHEFGNRNLKWSDTIYGFDTASDKIKISGTVYMKDGKTPAKDVLLYIYHTDNTGKYPSRATSTGWEKRHGFLRTWLKTDSSGNYEFYTSRPASYPNSTVPQHIHITVKEPNINEYYIEDFYFADDPNITPNIVNRSNPRGGSGVLSLKENGGLSTATRDILLGLNIPNY